MDTICPRCHGNGLIERVKLTNPEVEFNVCDECDSMWTTMNIEANNCINFKKFMNELGLKGLWEELYDINIL